MKRIQYIFVLFAFMGIFTSCKDEDKDYRPKVEDVPQILVKYPDPNKSFYNLNDLASNPEFKFTVDFDDRGVDIASVEVYKTLDAAITFTPRMLVTTLTSFPVDVVIPLNEAIKGIEVEDQDTGGNPIMRPLEVTDLGIAPSYEDTFYFTFEIVRKDGRRIIYTITDEDCYLTGNPQYLEPYSAWAPVREP